MGVGVKGLWVGRQAEDMGSSQQAGHALGWDLTGIPLLL